jgi:hypothetical protein
MSNVYADKFYSSREELIRNFIGTRLDTLRRDLSQLDSPCSVKLVNLPKGNALTIDNLLSLDSTVRQQILSTLLYNDAYFRLEAAYLTFCIGMLNITYSNLRSCLETIVDAHIIENLDNEAIQFLKKGEVDRTKIALFVPKEYNQQILDMKKALSELGVHSHLRSIQLSSLFGPNAFEKMISKTSTKHEQNLHPAFVDAANKCYQMIGSVFITFMYLMHKGTKYSSTSVSNPLAKS